MSLGHIGTVLNDKVDLAGNNPGLVWFLKKNFAKKAFLLVYRENNHVG